MIQYRLRCGGPRFKPTSACVRTKPRALPFRCLPVPSGQSWGLQELRKDLCFCLPPCGLELFWGEGDGGSGAYRTKPSSSDFVNPPDISVEKPASIQKHLTSLPSLFPKEGHLRSYRAVLANTRSIRLSPEVSSGIVHKQGHPSFPVFPAKTELVWNCLGMVKMPFKGECTLPWENHA